MKRPWVPDAGFDPAGTARVAEVCSASECLAEGPVGWEKRWDFNRAGCYATAAQALATLAPTEIDQFTVFAFWLVPGNAGVSDPFDPTLPALPPAGPSDCEALGFDVVDLPVYEPGGAHLFPGFGCSPLSCNGLLRKAPVNRYCLLDDVGEAIRLANEWNATQADVEPGTYFVVKVARAATGPK